MTSVVSLESLQNIPNDKTRVLDNFIDSDEVLHEKDRELEHDHNLTNKIPGYSGRKTQKRDIEACASYGSAGSKEEERDDLRPSKNPDLTSGN